MVRLTHVAPNALKNQRPEAMDIPKEVNMLEVTPAATEQIAAYFNGKEVKPIRIFLNEGG